MLPTLLTGFDTETTGVDPETCRIVSAAIVQLDTTTGQIVDSHEYLIDPGIEIPAEASAVHGITTDRARADGMPAREGIMRIIAKLADLLMTDDGDPVGAPLVVYNAPFDLTLLDREARRHMLIGLEETVDDDGRVTPAPWWGADRIPIIDPLVIDKHVDRYRRGPRNLGAVCAHLGIETEGIAHTARADAIAATRLAARMLAAPVLEPATLGQIHTASTQWAREQADSLRDYFLGRGDADRAATVAGDWPTRPYTDPESDGSRS